MSSEATSDEKDYEVGYGKPPKSGQFKKGQSGNPGGGSKAVRARKAKTASFGDLFSEGMQRPVEVEENGKKVVLTRMHLAIRRRVEEAAKGKTRPLKELLKLRDVKDAGPLAPAKRLVLTLDEARAAGPLDVRLYDPNVVIVRDPKPGGPGGPAKRKPGEAESNPQRRSAGELIEIELKRQIQVTDAATGTTKRMTMREVIAEQVMRLFVAGRPGANELMMKLNKQTDVVMDHKVYVGVPWDFEMPPRCDRYGRPLAAGGQQQTSSSNS